MDCPSAEDMHNWVNPMNTCYLIDLFAANALIGINHESSALDGARN